MTAIPRSVRHGRRNAAVILHGQVDASAPPDEQDVLHEAAAVADGLAALGWEPVTVPLSLDLAAARRGIERIKPAFVFNLVESIGGDGRLIHFAPALLDAVGLPYTGCRTEAMFLTNGKPLAKRMLAAAGIETPAWIDPERIGRQRPAFAGPYIVKSVWEHASIGLDADSLVDDPRRLAELVRRRRRVYGGDWFAETYIEGREFNLSVVEGPGGPQVLPPAEMRFIGFPAGKPRIVDYAAKWREESFEYRNTVRSFELAPEDGALAARLVATAEACWRLFRLSGYARVDFRVDALGHPYVLEVNANPCISPDGGLVAAAGEAGLSFLDLLRRIVAATGVTEPAVRRPQPKQAALAALPAAE
jgi:D-alanine-D-alanine ligase